MSYVSLFPAGQGACHLIKMKSFECLDKIVFTRREAISGSVPGVSVFH